MPSKRPTADPPPFRPLGEYVSPSTPADDAVRSVWARLKLVFAEPPEAAPLISEDRLQRATDGGFAPSAARPSCGPLQRELDATFSDWAAAAPSPFLPRLQLIVLPPGDGNGEDGGVLCQWAERRGFDVLPPPERTGRGGFAKGADRPPEIAGKGTPLVIPRLERWFLRRHDGLAPVRALLRSIDRTGRRCVIGCNSWAWAFLRTAVEAHLLLPNGRTFRAFDADRLAAWFREMARRLHSGPGGEPDPALFRLSATGGVVLGSDEQSEAKNYYRVLAARSLGIPWVAWDLWRRSLRSEKQAEHDAANGDADDQAAAEASQAPDEPERRTLWVAALEEFTLPSRREPDALLILQALLIHGPLTEAELRSVLPAVRGAGIGLLSALAGAGFVTRLGERLICAPAAYPSVRAGLAAAGFPTDRL